jgi:membrane protein DedA with SNARE-associated domain
MIEPLENLSHWIEGLIGTLGYPGLALVMFLENVFPPIPSELVMPFAGFMAGRGQFTFLGIVLWGTLGSVLGALVLYYLGRWIGEPVLRTSLRRWGRFALLSERDLDQAMRAFGKYGGVIMLFGRLVPGSRSLISIPAGIEHMPLPKFVLYTAIGPALWNTALGGAGLLLGARWREVLIFLEQYEFIVAIGGGLGLLLFGVLSLPHIRQRLGKPTTDD